MYVRNPTVEEAPLQTDLMLFDPERSQFFVLNRTMAFLWRNCDGTRTMDHILASLRTEFSEVEGVPVETEMRQALTELVDLGLVRTT